MRIVFECYAIYSALICPALCMVLALSFGDDKIEWVARKVINISFMIYGPVMSFLCMCGIHNIHSLARVCTVNGMSAHTNYVNLFVLISCLVFSIFVNITMIIEQTMDMA